MLRWFSTRLSVASESSQKLSFTVFSFVKLPIRLILLTLYNFYCFRKRLWEFAVPITARSQGPWLLLVATINLCLEFRLSEFVTGPREHELPRKERALSAKNKTGIARTRKKKLAVSWKPHLAVLVYSDVLTERIKVIRIKWKKEKNWTCGRMHACEFQLQARNDNSPHVAHAVCV